MMRAPFVAQIHLPALSGRGFKYNKPHATATSSNETGYKRDLSDLMKVLETDSPNLFSEQGTISFDEPQSIMKFSRIFQCLLAAAWSESTQISHLVVCELLT
jgi:hypothetical protein